VSTAAQAAKRAEGTHKPAMFAGGQGQADARATRLSDLSNTR